MNNTNEENQHARPAKKKTKKQELKSYTVLIRYLVAVEVEATDEESAIEEAQLNERDGDWETLDVQVEAQD